MQLICKVNQPTAIKRGFNCNSTVKLDVDISTLTPEQRDMLGDWFVAGEFKQVDPHAPSASYRDTWQAMPQPDLNGLLEQLNVLIEDRSNRRVAAAEEKAAAELRARAAQEAAQEAAQRQLDEVNSKILAGEPLDLMRDQCGNVYSEYVYHSLPGNLQSSERLLSPAALGVLNAAKEEYRAQKERAAAVEKAAQEAKQQKEAAVQAQLESVLERLGTAAQKGRYAAGLLNLEDEIIPLLKMEAFKPLEALNLKPHEKITASDVRDLLPADWEEPELAEVRFHDPHDADLATDEEWVVMEAIRAALPESVVKLQTHNGDIDWDQPGYAADLYRNSLLVSITVGAITLSTRYSSPRGDY
jgi:hypothetical protein